MPHTHTQLTLMLHWVCVCVWALAQGGWRFWWVYEYEETAGNASRPAETHRELEVENWAETASETEREERKEEDRQRKWAARRREITDSHIAGEIRLNIKSTRSPHWLLLNNTHEQSDRCRAPVVLTRILSEGPLKASRFIDCIPNIMLPSKIYMFWGLKLKSITNFRCEEDLYSEKIHPGCRMSQEKSVLYVIHS